MGVAGKVDAVGKVLVGFVFAMDGTEGLVHDMLSMTLETQL